MKKSERSSDHKGFKKNIIDLLESYFHKIIGSVDKQDAPGFRDAKEGAEIVRKLIIGENNILTKTEGRLYNRFMVAKILTELWEETATKDVDFWNNLIDNIEKLYASILRNDANHCIYPVFIILSNSADAANEHSNDTFTPLPQQTCEVNDEELSKSIEIKNYNDIIDQCRIQQYTSKISQLQNSADNYHAQVKECKEFVARHFRNNQKQEMLMLSVFQQPYGYTILKAPEEVDRILAELADFKQFQADFTKTLRAWESKLSLPTLVKLQYDLPPDGALRPAEGNTVDKKSSSKVVQELKQATKSLSKAQRNGPDPTSVANTIANNAFSNGNMALRTDEASSLPDVECTMKKRKATDATTFSSVTDDDTRARPIRRRIPTNFFHNEFSQKEGLPVSEQSECGDIFLSESEEVKSRRRQNTGIGDSAHDANTSGTKMNASPGEEIAIRKLDDSRKEANNSISGSPERQPNETRVPTEFSISEFSPSKDLNFTEKHVEIQSAPMIEFEEEELSRCHGILAPVVCNNNHVPNKSPPLKKANKSLNKALCSGQLEEAKGTVIMMNRVPGEQSITGHPHPKRTDNNQENQDVLAATPVGNMESKETARERKKRETAIMFDDSDASVLSSIESPRDHADTTNNRQTTVQASNHLKENISRIIGRKKRAFTQEEKNALRLGIKKFGVGKWSLIKSEYSDIFRYRTSVQIKDLYRTMTKNSVL